MALGKYSCLASIIFLASVVQADTLCTRITSKLSSSGKVKTKLATTVVAGSSPCPAGFTAALDLSLLMGPPGVPGTPGATSATGSTGADGADGDPGSDGATGATGSTGADGMDGDPGSDGATGATGSTGAPGSDALNNSMFIGRTDDLNTAVGNLYYYPSGHAASAGGVTFADAAMVVPVDCTIADFRVVISTTPSNMTFRRLGIFVNNAMSASLSCDIASGATSCTSGNTFAVSEGSLVAIGSEVQFGTTSASGDSTWAWTCTPTTP